jgi:hypothetical protein
MTIPAAAAVVASNTAIMAARAATGPCSLILVGAVAPTDILTVSFVATLAATPYTAGIKITLTAAAGDTLAVTASDTTGIISIALANTTPAKNTASLIQAAIRSVNGGAGAGLVKGISVAAIVCAAGGNWDTATVAPGTGMTALPFTGGAGETITPNVTALLAQPISCRTISATAGGTGGDIGAVSVIVYGTNINDEAISETLTAFTVNTAATKTGLKAFKTITSIFLPSHDGTGATISIGYSEVFGVPFKFAKVPYLKATLAGVIETTVPTVTTSSTVLCLNTVKINSTCNGTEICLYWFLP